MFPVETVKGRHLVSISEFVAHQKITKKAGHPLAPALRSHRLSHNDHKRPDHRSAVVILTLIAYKN